MPKGRALPLVGLAAGTTMMVLGSTQLSAVWMAGQNWPQAERTKVGVIGGGFVVLGTLLQALASYELAQAHGSR